MSKASQRAYGMIRAMILSGELRPGEQLAEEQLAERCGVSRTPVREALRQLQTELLITRSESQRSFVSRWSDDDVADSFELRAMVEAHAARLAALRHSPAHLAQMQQHNRQLARAIARTPPDVPAFLEANRAFHEIIVEAAASPRLASMLALVIEQPVVQRTARNYDSESLARSHAEHQELLAAFARRDADWAASVMTSHIRRAYHAFADANACDKAA